MKDTILTTEVKKRELKIFAIIFAFAYSLNIVGIIIYNTRWIELISMLPLVLTASLAIYVIIGIFRLIPRFIIRQKK